MSAATIQTSDSIESQSQRVFHLFPQLPIELQDKIWVTALGPPRLVEMQGNYLIGNIALISSLSSVNANERPFSNNEGVRVLGAYINSFCCPPVTLHVCGRSRRLALELYETCFTNDSKPDMLAFLEAVYAFGIEWAGDADGIGAEFLEKEKALFDEATAILTPFVLEKYVTAKAKLSDSVVWENLEQKKRSFELNSQWLLRTKLYFEKVKSRPFGIWFRPTCDTILLRAGSSNGNVDQVLRESKIDVSNTSNIKSFVLDMAMFRDPNVWFALFGGGPPLIMGPDMPQKRADELNAKFHRALLTDLDELILIINAGCYDHFVDGKYVEYTPEEVAGLKQQCHDLVIHKMKCHSELKKIPKIRIERERDMYSWTRWGNPIQPVGDTLVWGRKDHSDDCHRASKKDLGFGAEW